MLLLGIDALPLGPVPVAPGGEWRGADLAAGTHGPSMTGVVVRLPKTPGGRSRQLARFPIVTIGSTLTFSIPRSLLGGARWFTFTVAAARESAEETGDGARHRPRARHAALRADGVTGLREVPPAGFEPALPP